LVKSNRGCSLSAGEANQAIAVQQRMSGETPHRSFDVKVFLEIVRPEDLAFIRIQAEKVAFAAQSKNLSFAYQRSHARSGGITHGVWAIILMLPDQFTIGFVEAENPFAAINNPAGEGVGRVGYPRRKLAIGQIDVTLRNDRAGIARADLGPPKD